MRGAYPGGSVSPNCQAWTSGGRDGGTPPLTPPPAQGGWGRGGCSSYQRLSKFAEMKRDPILKPGLRGNSQKSPTTCVLRFLTQKRVKKPLILGFFCHFWGFFGVLGQKSLFLGQKRGSRPTISSQILPPLTAHLSTSSPGN